MVTNRAFLNKQEFTKAMISLPLITLTPEEADRFIDYIVDQSVLKANARIEKMAKPTKRIRALGLSANRFLYRGDKFSEAHYTKKFLENSITLTSKKVRGCVVIYDDDLEDNIEGDAFMDHVIKLITAKIANELEEAFWIADTHAVNPWAADDIRGLFDGWRYQITHSALGQQYYNKVTGGAWVYNACEGGGSANPFQFADGIAFQDPNPPYHWEFKYANMIKLMPSAYKMKGLSNFRFFNSDLVTADWLDALQQRATAIGDAALTGALKPAHGGVPIVDVPLMPHNLGDPTLGQDGVIGAGDYTDSMLTHKDNLIIGIQREIKMETERKASDEATLVFYSMRVDLAIENVNAIVFVRCLTHRC